MQTTTELDHIVIGCNSLDEARAWCREVLGVEASGGGKHAGIGTHNTLLSLGSKHYLEFIAIDPEAPVPSVPRWFGLDTDEVKSRIAHEPRLIAWVARVARDSASEAIEEIARLPGNPANDVRLAERGDFRWRFAFTHDGALPRGGVLPYFIQWDVPHHPCERLADADVMLASLVLAAPAPESVSSLLDKARFADPKVQVGQSTAAHLVATLHSPRGLIVLE
jgi:catechol 2,3-dioxygenase-like lactoylglutathione lyase family enzyme